MTPITSCLDEVLEEALMQVATSLTVTSLMTAQTIRPQKSGGTAVVAPPPAGNAARCLGRRRSSGGRRLAGA
jgi:hypothetical protein